MNTTRHALRKATVHSRAIVAVGLALGLILAIAALAWAAPVVSIDSGPSGPTRDTAPQFGFTVDGSATTVECSIDDGVTPAYEPCTSASTHQPAAPLSDGAYVFRVRAVDDNLEETVETRAFSVDTTPPSLSVDSGPSGPTRDATPSFGFTAEGGSTVECSIDQGTPAFGPCASATTHEPGAPLGDGSFTFRVRATDGVGNRATSTRSFSVDTTPPSLSVDSGPAGPTRATTPSFGFTAEGGSTVECSVDQGTPAYGPCSTTSSHTSAALADGSHTFRVRATDGVGNSATATRSFSVDTTPPSLSVDSGPAGPTRDATPSFGFTAEPGATVECSVDQGIPSYRSCTSGSSHTSASLADGSHTFRVRATDGVGNSATATRSFSVDTTPPSLSIGSGPSGATNVTTPSFGFTAEGGSTVECSVDQGTPVYGSCSTTSSHTATTLAEGSYTFRVRATDGVGNSATATRSFSVDTTPPSLSIDSGPSGPTSDNTPSFGFSHGTGTVECSTDQGTPAYGSCTTTTSHTAASLPDGSHTFRVRVTDTAGNQAVETRSFSVDTTPPSLSVDSGPAGPTRDATPTFDFTPEAGATVECSIDQGAPSYRSCSSGSSHTSAALADGSYTFRVRATDGVGNRATATQAFSVDSAAPSLTIDAGPAGPTNVAAPSFGFTAEAGTTVECSIDDGTPAYGPCTSAATYVVGAPLVDGRHVFRVRATKLVVGNQAVETRSFTVDTTPPSLSIGFGPSGTTNDSTPLFGFSAEAGSTIACSIDQGTPAFGPCASATTHAAGAPLSDGAYVFRVRATDGVGNHADRTRDFTVDTVPDPPVPETPRRDPTTTPPVTTPPVTRTPTVPRLMSPFPLVRISGTLTPTGARIRLLSVQAPRGAVVRVSVSPPCGRRRSARRCHVLQAAGTVGRSAAIGFRGLERRYHSGTVIVVRVWAADRIGKFTRFTIVRGKAPRRVDQCLVPEATRGSRCPSA